jgi:hypothetical protein
LDGGEENSYGAFALFLIGLLVTRAEAQDNAPTAGAIPQNVPPAISQTRPSTPSAFESAAGDDTTGSELGRH